MQIMKENDIDSLHQKLSEGLLVYNSKYSKFLDNIFTDEIIGFSALQEERIIGGITACVRDNHSWIYIEQLWIDPEYRGLNIGTQLITELEKYAVSLGCIQARTDTWDFQAKPFYEKLGYKTVAEVKNCPPGTTEYILIKRPS